MNAFELIGAGIVLIGVWNWRKVVAVVSSAILNHFVLQLNDDDNRFVSYKAIKSAIGFRKRLDGQYLSYLTVDFPDKCERLSYSSMSNLFEDRRNLMAQGLVDLDDNEKDD